jgi:hypothetical protein
VSYSKKQGKPRTDQSPKHRTQRTHNNSTFREIFIFGSQRWFRDKNVEGTARIFSGTKNVEGMARIFSGTKNVEGTARILSGTENGEECGRNGQDFVRDKKW